MKSEIEIPAAKKLRRTLRRMSRCLTIVLLGGGIFLGLAPLGLTGSSQAALKFVFPLVCTINTDCFFVNYIDQRAGSGVQDYQCGPITYNGHQGIDITLPNFRLMDRGVYVLAAAAGTVAEMQDGLFDRNKQTGPGYGNHIVIEHAGGARTIYGHLKKNSLKVRVGQQIVAGEEIAEVGSSGNSTDAHLHFEVRDDSGRIVEPFQGPCGNSVSWWEEQPAYEDDFQVLDYGMTNFEPTIAQLKERPATRTDYTSNDPLFLFWVQVKSVKPGDVARVEFYAPDGRLFRRSTFDHDRYFRYSWWYWFWNRSAWAGLPTGQWTVKYFLNNRLQATMPFRVSAPSPRATPEIWLAETELDFGSVKVGESRTYRLIVENIGRANLQVSIAGDDPEFRAETTSVTIPPGRKELIAVAFSPTTAGERSTEITLTSNDPDEGTLTVEARGRGED